MKKTMRMFWKRCCEKLLEIKLLVGIGLLWGKGVWHWCVTLRGRVAVYALRENDGTRVGWH